MVGEVGIRRGWASRGLAFQPPALLLHAALKLYQPQMQKSRSISATAFSNMVGEEGFEPPTLWSQTRCATKLRYSPRCLTEDLSPSTDAYITDSFERRKCFLRKNLMS